MSEPSPPSLPAIRERATAWQAQSDAIPGAAWPDRLVRVMLADLEVVLALVARLQGEREELREALEEIEDQALSLHEVCGGCRGVLAAARAAVGEE